MCFVHFNGCIQPYPLINISNNILNYCFRPFILHTKHQQTSTTEPEMYNKKCGSEGWIKNVTLLLAVQLCIILKSKHYNEVERHTVISKIYMSRLVTSRLSLFIILYIQYTPLGSWLYKIHLFMLAIFISCSPHLVAYKATQKTL